MPLATMPRVSLCALPTPLQRVRNFEAALGPDSPRIYLKRDDLTGLAIGGNKSRKLEYLVADALMMGATVLITEGAVQSNHARMTAAAAAASGLRSALVLDTRNGDEVAGNLLLDYLFGAEVHLVADPSERSEKMLAVAKALEARGERPYVVPTGGSVPIGAAGYVRASLELADQLVEAGEAPVRLYSASGSLGTQAGLIVGAKLVSATYGVHGVAVSHATSPMETRCADLCTQTAALLGLPQRTTESEVILHPQFVGEAYGRRTRGGVEAITLLAQTEGILLDPVYSSKAMSGLIAHIRDHDIRADESVVFLHTGGAPALFAHGAALLEQA